ncbi:DUF4129 domain-containing protein [Kitasatospora sp. NBC_01287]|uniref:DUF4129 domain-containing protein n=1 Tax=Kitasatospora sp. NBC_01287 TaxID=2903573 RepID=UPI00224E10E2|nr:DUF4129 domain-containing protein [Kitasatospora sp. NBC_01287]MCX4745512.1 DUF4129 domain-containing protein [Kitasatospora sp. NBC_01287]
MTPQGGPGRPDQPGPQRPDTDESARTTKLRRALALGAVAGLAFAALELRPDSNLLSGGGAPLSDEFGLVLLLGLGWLVLLERTLRYYRGQVRDLYDLPPRADRLRTAALRLLPLVAIALPAVLLFVYRGANHTPTPDGSLILPTPPHIVSSRPLPLVHPGNARHHNLLSLLALGVKIAVVLAVLAAVVAVWRLLRRLPKPRLPHGATTRTRTDERELARAIASARRALLNAHDARTAVIACYLAMEDSLAASGIERRIADSPTDLLHRATTTGTLHGPAATTLTDLFREARYSQHPMDHTHLHHARTALDTIATQLDAQLDAAAAETGAETTPETAATAAPETQQQAAPPAASAKVTP